MKTVKHLCFTSHCEVMFRNPDDVGVMINLLALNSWKYNVSILADCEMSTHVHLIVMADSGNVSDFIKTLRFQYTYYFNSKYDRRRYTRLGEKNFFQLDVFGCNHIQSALSYVLRNPVHHGVTQTPFAYPFSSANEMFSIEMGRFEHPHVANIREYSIRENSKYGRKIVEKNRTGLLTTSNLSGESKTEDNFIASRREIKTYLPRNSEWPDGWAMDRNGVFLRTCFEEIKQAEGYFVTPGTFQFCMFRKSDDKWLEEQKNDKNDKPPVQLSDIEPFANHLTLNEFLTNERGFSRRCNTNYFELCAIIDNCFVPRCQCGSVYNLSDSQKSEIKSMLVRDLRVSPTQVDRCLGM